MSGGPEDNHPDAGESSTSSGVIAGKECSSFIDTGGGGAANNDVRELVDERVNKPDGAEGGADHHSGDIMQMPGSEGEREQLKTLTGEVSKLLQSYLGSIQSLTVDGLDELRDQGEY